MNVHLYYLVVLYYHYAVADGLQISAQRVGRAAAVLFGDYHFSAVGVVYLAVVHSYGVFERIYRDSRRFVGRLSGRSYLAALEYTLHFFEYYQQTHSARVNYSRFRELRQQVRRVVQRFFRLSAHLAPYHDRVVGRKRGLARFFRSFARYCKYSALGRLHYRLVSALYASFQAFGYQFAGKFVAVFQRFCKAAEYQRKYYARISASAAQHTRSRFCGSFAHGSCFGQGRVRYCHRHICARIAVGYGENV